jgi:hypothetical protein
MDENKALEGSQDTPQKLFFGKYKTLEEAEAAMTELHRNNTDLRSQLDAERNVNKLFSDGHTEPKNSGYVPMDVPSTFDDETVGWLKRREEQLANSILGEAQKYIGQVLTAKEFVNEFFSENPDLKNYRDLAKVEYDQLQREMGGRLNVNKDTLTVLAGRVRKRVSEIQASAKTPPPHLESGTSQDRSKPASKETHQEPTDEENLKSFMDDRKKEQERRLNLRN